MPFTYYERTTSAQWILSVSIICEEGNGVGKFGEHSFGVAQRAKSGALTVCRYLLLSSINDAIDSINPTRSITYHRNIY